MALCLAISLVTCQRFFAYDQLVRYKWWFRDGYMSATGICFDIGAATKRSLMLFEDRQCDFCDNNNIPRNQMDYLTYQVEDKFDVMCKEDGIAGNGALMRLAPVPLFFHRDPKEAVRYSEMSAQPTHSDRRAYDACRYYGALIVAAINGESKDNLLSENFYEKHKAWFDEKPLHDDIKKIMQGSYKKKNGYKDGIRGSGFVVGALEAALWAFWTDKGSFECGALAAVNLGDDADTTAAIYGQLAGAHYGYRELPQKWLQYLYGNAFIGCLSQWIVCQGAEWHRKKSSNLATITTSNSKTTSSIPIATINRPINISNTISTNEELRPRTFESSIRSNSVATTDVRFRPNQISGMHNNHQITTRPERNEIGKVTRNPLDAASTLHSLLHNTSATNNKEPQFNLNTLAGRQLQTVMSLPTNSCKYHISV